MGFHGTNALDSVGRPASHASIRLYPEHARRMFRQVWAGMPIYAVYEPIKIGWRDGVYYLSVSTDIFRRGGASLAGARKRLREEGLLPYVDPAHIRRIVALQDGHPRPITSREGASGLISL